MSVTRSTVASMTPRGKMSGQGQGQATNGGGNGNGNAAMTGGGGGGNAARDRGQNINHLLAFTLPPRARPPAPTNRRSKRNAGSGGSQPFNKERYVAAQYRFLVKPTGDYTAYFADSDIYLNWGDILSVIIPTSSALSNASNSNPAMSSQPSLESHEGAACPICLSPPTAPRMTKCGHVYCYPCILQYLATTDGPASAGPHPVPGAPVGHSVNSGNALTGPTNRQWKRCPICWDAVYARDLKAVKWWDPKAVAEDKVHELQDDHNDDIVGHLEGFDGKGGQATQSSSQSAEYLPMRLIERPQITTLALPQSSTWPTSSTSPSDQPLIAQHQAPWHFQPDVMTYCKFMLATPDLLLASLTQDMDELTAERKLLTSFGSASTHGDSSMAYLGIAEKKVQEQMAKVVNELDTPAVKSAIGQAKNDMKDHEEAEKSRQLRDNENMSRRRRRQLEREHQLSLRRKQEEDGEADAEAGIKETAEAEAETRTLDHATEDAAGAEEFLALKSQGQGGAYIRQKDAGAVDDSLQDASTPIKTAHSKPRRNLNPPAPSSSSFLFYQASSGQNIFLHPLDIKILHSQFGAYSRFPRNIAVKVQGAEEGSMNEELRKRCRYLAHLPKGTDVVFVEVDWEGMAALDKAEGADTAGKPTDQKGEGEISSAHQPLVSRATLKPYEQVLRARRNKRRDRERKEDRAKLRAEEAEAASRPGGARTGLAGGPGSHSSRQSDARGGLGRSYGSESAHSYLSASGFDNHRISHSHSQSHGEGDEEGDDDHGSDVHARSPTFMEAALWGAEREFPIHPGTTGEDFPAALASTATPSPNFGPIGGGVNVPTPAGTAARKTVWGTPAARPSFSSTLHSSSRSARQGGGGSGGDWDDGFDDAWLELEEGFVLGANNSKTVKAGRGLNTQQASSPGTTGRKPSQVGKAASASKTGSSTAKAKDEDSDQQRQQQQQESSAEAVAVPPQGKQGKKQRKAKLVLTSGGRGTG